MNHNEPQEPKATLSHQGIVFVSAKLPINFCQPYKRTHRHFSLNNLSTHTSFTLDIVSAVRRGQGRSLQDCTKHWRLRLRCCWGCCSSLLLFRENPLPSPPTIRVQLLLRVHSSSLQNLLLLFYWREEKKHIASSQSGKQKDGWEGWELG